MQSLGMRFGAHVNAHTSFDETVYELQIPTGNPAVIDRSLLILEDWAHNVSFDPVEIDKERGVILEEWRLGLGAGERMQDAQIPVLLKGSRYAERLPIGKPEIIRNVESRSAEAVLRRLVPARPDGGHRRRRFRQGRGRGADHDRTSARFRRRRLRSRGRPTPCRTSPERSIRSITDPEVTQHEHQRLQQDGRARPGDGRRLPAADGRAAVQRHAVRRGSTRSRKSRTRRFSRPRPAAGSSCAPTEATSLNALVATGGVERGSRRCSPRSTAWRGSASPRPSSSGEKLQSAARSGARGRSRRTRARPARWPTSSSATSSRASRFPASCTSTRLNQRFLPEITLAEVNGLAEGLDARPQPRRRDHRAREGPGVAARPRRSWRPSSPRPAADR